MMKLWRRNQPLERPEVEPDWGITAHSKNTIAGLSMRNGGELDEQRAATVRSVKGTTRSATVSCAAPRPGVERVEVDSQQSVQLLLTHSTDSTHSTHSTDSTHSTHSTDQPDLA